MFLYSGLTIRGIYRECGNASLMHKLRILTDQGMTYVNDNKPFLDIVVLIPNHFWLEAVVG